MTYADNHGLLLLAKNSRANSVTVMTDPGEFRLTVLEALDYFESIAPGEYFQVISINFE